MQLAVSLGAIRQKQNNNNNKTNRHEERRGAVRGKESKGYFSSPFLSRLPPLTNFFLTSRGQLHKIVLLIQLSLSSELKKIASEIASPESWCLLALSFTKSCFRFLILYSEGHFKKNFFFEFPIILRGLFDRAAQVNEYFLPSRVSLIQLKQPGTIEYEQFRSKTRRADIFSLARS